MLCDVVSVSPKPDFQIDIEYANGERRRFDMRPLLNMKPWSRIAAPAMFSRASVNCGTVVWPRDIAIAPETLYDDSVSIGVYGLAPTLGRKQSAFGGAELARLTATIPVFQTAKNGYLKASNCIWFPSAKPRSIEAGQVGTSI